MMCQQLVELEIEFHHHDEVECFARFVSNLKQRAERINY